MEKKQEINCTVASCKYNDDMENRCMLKAIQVEPTPENNSQNPDESMCASYKCE